LAVVAPFVRKFVSEAVIDPGPTFVMLSMNVPAVWE
jgi:hypothetical protein